MSPLCEIRMTILKYVSQCASSYDRYSSFICEYYWLFVKHCEWRLLSLSHSAPCVLHACLIVLYLIILDRPWDDKLIFFVNNSCYQLWIYYDLYCLHNHRVVVTVSTKSVAPYSILSNSIEHTVTLTGMRVSFTLSTAEMLSINLWDSCL
jgi:hypothetical protein